MKAKRYFCIIFALDLTNASTFSNVYILERKLSESVSLQFIFSMIVILFNLIGNIWSNSWIYWQIYFWHSGCFTYLFLCVKYYLFTWLQDNIPKFTTWTFLIKYIRDKVQCPWMELQKLEWRLFFVQKKKKRKSPKRIFCHFFPFKIGYKNLKF